jgi:hypothetical protein
LWEIHAVEYDVWNLNSCGDRMKNMMEGRRLGIKWTLITFPDTTIIGYNNCSPQKKELTLSYNSLKGSRKCSLGESPLVAPTAGLR